MFAKYYLELPLPAGVVGAALLQELLESWLPDHVQAGGRLENHLLAEVGFQLGPRRVGRRVAIKVGAPVTLGGTLLLPMSVLAGSLQGQPFPEPGG